MWEYNYDYLCHHGIPGQKWGVRHGPPYPIEDKTLKKGMQLNSVSTTLNTKQYIKRGKAIYTYNPEDPWDSKVYKGPFSYYLVMARGAQFIKEHKFVVKKDAKMPTKQERIDEFKDVLNTNKDAIKEIEAMRNYLAQKNNIDPYWKKKYEKLVVSKDMSDDDIKTAYNLFNHLMEYSYKYSSTRDYMNRMSKKYDAMVDDNNQGVYNEAHDPIIIFKGQKFLAELKEKGGSSILSGKDIMSNFKDVEEEMHKKGKNIAI